MRTKGSRNQDKRKILPRPLGKHLVAYNRRRGNCDGGVHATMPTQRGRQRCCRNNRTRGDSHSEVDNNGLAHNNTRDGDNRDFDCDCGFGEVRPRHVELSVLGRKTARCPHNLVDDDVSGRSAQECNNP
jgi:hypothetical protein